MDFRNKVVMITGASSGIGEALVYQFDKLGAKIVIAARRVEELERVKNNCKNPQNILIQRLDLENHEEIPLVAENVLKQLKKIDILINNGGVSQRSLVKDTALEVDRKIMNINFLGTVALTKAVLPSMLQYKSGHIVVISSITGKIGVKLRSAYAASKHALHGFFDSLRYESVDDNIHVTIVCPGYIRTNVSINALTADGSAQNSMDEATANGLDPNFLAKKIIDAVMKKKEEVIIAGKKEKLGIYLKRFFPSLLTKVMSKAKVT